MKAITALGCCPVAILFVTDASACSFTAAQRTDVPNAEAIFTCPGVEMLQKLQPYSADSNVLNDHCQTITCRCSE
jgi:hypothetical protein